MNELRGHAFPGLPRDSRRPMGRKSVEQHAGSMRLSVAGLALRPKLGLAHGLQDCPAASPAAVLRGKVMLQSSRFFAILLGVALATPAVVGCTASASFKSGGEEAKAPPPPPPPPPPATPDPAPAPAPAATTAAPAPPAAPAADAKPVLKKDKLEIPGQIVF